MARKRPTTSTPKRTSRVVESQLAKPSLAQIVRDARGTMGQKEFALKLGVRQDSLSKYERDKAHPPRHVIETCLAIVDAQRVAEAPDVRAVAKKVEAALSGPEHTQLRGALATLLDYLISQRPPRGRTSVRAKAAGK